MLSAHRPGSGASMRILVATAKGDERAYLVEVFASGSAALVEAQVLLNTLRLDG